MSTQIVAYPEATTWLYGELTTAPLIAGVDMRVFEDAAPEGTTTRDGIWIEFELQAPGEDVAEVAEQRIWTEFAFLVRAVTQGRSTKALGPAATEIDARLHRKSGTTSGGRVVSSVRTQEHQAHWLEQGVEYRALGGFYSLIVQSLNP